MSLEADRSSAAFSGQAIIDSFAEDDYYHGLSDTVSFRIGFSDITDASTFYYEPVCWAVDLGSTTGWADGTFRPWNICSHASVVTFLWRMANLDG